MIIQTDDDGQRLDRFLKKAFPQLTFGQSQKLIRTGQIRINGKRAKSDSRLQQGDELRLPPSLQNTSDAPKIQFSQKDRDAITDMILHEDDHILILNKPARLAVQGGSKTLRHIDGMLNSYIKRGVKPRLTHRLDKDTSGVLILAKTAEAARELTHDFQSHNIQKTYWALTYPAHQHRDGIIDAKIAKSSVRSDGGEMMIHDEDHGQKAITEFEVIDHAGKDIAFVAFYPKTGRTHQIRVHAKILGAPLLGDRKYNDNPFPPESQEIYQGLHLHAHSVSLLHPMTKEPITIQAPLPKSFEKSWKYYGFAV
jgi:23S rRNA pseudouridine955/2504/2580 synthase